MIPQKIPALLRFLKAIPAMLILVFGLLPSGLASAGHLEQRTNEPHLGHWHCALGLNSDDGKILCRASCVDLNQFLGWTLHPREWVCEGPAIDEFGASSYFCWYQVRDFPPVCCPGTGCGELAGLAVIREAQLRRRESEPEPETPDPEPETPNPDPEPEAPNPDPNMIASGGDDGGNNGVLIGGGVAAVAALWLFNGWLSGAEESGLLPLGFRLEPHGNVTYRDGHSFAEIGASARYGNWTAEAFSRQSDVGWGDPRLHARWSSDALWENGTLYVSARHANGMSRWHAGWAQDVGSGIYFRAYSGGNWDKSPYANIQWTWRF